MLTKYASMENVQVLELKSSPTKVRHASLGKLADFHQYRTDDGFLYARIRAISSRVNKNHDGWPSIELAGGQDVFDHHTSSADGFTITADSNNEYGFSTFLGKPIFVDHHNTDPKRSRGVIVDAQFHVDDHRTSSLDPYYSSPDVDPEHLPGTWVELLLEVDAKSFPKFAKEIVEGSRNPKKGIDGWSMGADIEFSKCSVCDNKAIAPDDFCKHVKMKGAYFDSTDPKTGHKTSQKAYENCYGVKFFEISGVFDPADETALSREVRSHTLQDRAKKFAANFSDYKNKLRGKQVPLKDLADIQQEELIDEEHEKQLKRKQGAPLRPNEDMTDYQQMSPVKQVPHSRLIECPNCAGMGTDNNEQTCPMCRGEGSFETPQSVSDYTYDYQPEYDSPSFIDDPNTLGPRHQGSVHTADNPPPQSDLSHAPEKVDTLRSEEVCPVCGSSMDEDTCDVCGYQEPPEGFGNPDLDKARDVDVPTQEPDDVRADIPQEPPNEVGPPEPQQVNTPTNTPALAHVTSDTSWEVHQKSSAQINKTEQPLVEHDKPQTNEPKEKILKDQSKPVTSKVRTAEDFIAAVVNKENNSRMKQRTADSAPPSNEPRNKGHHPMDDAANPEKVVDVTGVGGVIEPTNEEASKANGQVDVLGIGGTGVEAVSAGEADGGAEGVNVGQGTEHSKNIEAIPTETWTNDGRGNSEKGDSLGQHEPVTNVTPSWVDESKWSHWTVEGHEDEDLIQQDQQGGNTWADTTKPAVRGVKPIAEQFGDRVDVKDHVTSPENNSGPTKTWSGTDGNGVLQQQDPVTNESIAEGESGMTNSPNWTSSTHIFAAFKLADLEVGMGIIPEDKKYERAAELERETPEVITASLKYAQRVRKTAARKAAGAKKLPVMGRSTPVDESSLEKQASAETPSEDDSFMFGGL